MDFDAYVAEHAGEWRRLEQLSNRRRLNADEVDELVALYQRAATHLSVVRSRFPDPTLISRLSRLVLGARSAITGKRPRSWGTFARFFLVTFPLAVYRGRAWWISVTLACTALSGGLMAYVALNPDVVTLFLSQSEIDAIVESGFVSYYSENQPQDFAMMVWTNNAFLSAQCLASGVLILPVLYLLWANEFNLGLVGGVMIGNGGSEVFFTHILPHGMLELTCVYVAAGFGLRIAWAWIAPGRDKTRGRAMAETAREAMLVALGLIAVLFVSGLIEAYVTPSAAPAALRIGVGAMALIGFLAYVLILGRMASEAGASADLEDIERGALAPTS